MRIGMPVEVNRVIARRAVQKAREDMRKRSWTSTGALQPLAENGQVGITSTMKHLLIQNRGFEPFIMRWVEGRVIPMSCAQGDGPHMVLGKDAGKPGWVNIPHKGRVWRNQKWRHPGLKPKRFLETAITQAIKESKPDIQDAIMTVLRGERL